MRKSNFFMLWCSKTLLWLSKSFLDFLRFIEGQTGLIMIGISYESSSISFDCHQRWQIMMIDDDKWWLMTVDDIIGFWWWIDIHANRQKTLVVRLLLRLKINKWGVTSEKKNRWFEDICQIGEGGSSSNQKFKMILISDIFWRGGGVLSLCQNFNPCTF